MAKKNVVIFDGEDKFINPKKAVYSKTRGQAKKFESFKSLRASLQDEEGPTRSSSEEVMDAPSYSGSVYTPPAVEAQPSSGGSYEPAVSQIKSTVIDDYRPVLQTPSFQAPVIESPAELLNRFTPASYVEDDRKSTMPIYEAPVQAVFQPITQEPPYVAPTPILDDRKSTMPIYEAPVQAVFRPTPEEPPAYIAPTPQLPINPRLDDVYDGKRPPTRPTPPSDWENPDTGIGYKGVQKPILDDRLPNDGLPIDRNIIVGPSPNQPIYTAPVPPINDSPERSCPAGMRLYFGTCIPQDASIRDDDFLPKRGIPDERVPITPSNPYRPNPIYTAPVPPLPPRGRIIEDPMGGGGSPVMGGPEIPRPNCPTGFVFNATTGICTPKPILEKDPIQTPRTTSSTTTTTTKVAAAVPTTSSTTTTTTKAAVVDKTCNPPMYAAPKYYKWVSKGNCAYELVVDNTQLKDAAPAPVLPATGQPIININYPTGGLGTIPTNSTSTTVQTTTKSLLPLEEDSGGGAAGGGGGGSPFPEEPAPIGPAPKKNYFWWYVGGALAIYLLMKRKNKQ
jgi:hypothetical protein